MFFTSHTDVLRQYTHVLVRDLPLRDIFRSLFMANEFVSTFELNFLYATEKV